MAGLMFQRQAASSNFSFLLSDLSWCLSRLSLTLFLVPGYGLIAFLDEGTFFLSDRYYLPHKLDAESPYRV